MEKAKIIKKEECFILSSDEIVKLRYAVLRTMNTLRWAENFTEKDEVSRRIKIAHRELSEVFEMLE